MKKLIVMVLVAILALGLGTTAAVADTGNSIVFTLNSGQYSANGTSFPMDTPPMLINNRTMVPIRFLANALGVTDANIQWNQAEQTMQMRYQNIVLLLKIGSNNLLKQDNGQTTSVGMDVSPLIINNRTYLPARYIAEALGYKVAWNQETSQVIITANAAQGSNTGTGTGNQSSMTTYSNSSLGLSFKYPSGWQQTTIPNTNIAIRSDIDQGIFAVTTSPNPSGQEVPLPQLSQGIISNMAGVPTSSKTVVSDDNITISGLPGNVKVFTYTINGVLLKSALYVTETKNMIYIIDYTNSADAFAADMSVVSNIINSVTIANTGASSSMTTYSNSSIGLSFKYPSGWQQTTIPGNNIAMHSDIDQGIFAVTASPSPSGQEIPLPLLAQQILSNMPNVPISSITVVSTSDITISGLPGNVKVFTYTDNGVPLKSALYITETKNMIYIIDYINSADAFASDMSVVNNIINSVTIANGTGAV